MSINIQNTYKSFGKTKVLNGINITFNRGEIVALIGPNGSGKTTLLKSILGLTIPQKGNITVFDKPIQKNYTYREHIGYMPQIAHYPENLKVRELIQLFRNLRNNPPNTDEELFTKYRIAQMFEKPLSALSGGQKQKVGAYLAFLFHPDIIILDEPTAGLDPVSTEIIKAKIYDAKNTGKLIIITTHIMQDADELADRIVYLADGNIFLDLTINELKEKTGETKLIKALAKLIMEHDA